MFYFHFTMNVLPENLFSICVPTAINFSGCANTQIVFVFCILILIFVKSFIEFDGCVPFGIHYLVASFSVRSHFESPLNMFVMFYSS